jgi:hypothetical protein
LLRGLRGRKEILINKGNGGRMRSKLFAVIGIPLGLGVFFIQEAYAYLDPGTGSYIYQLLIAFVIGGLYAVKLFWKKIIFSIRNLFRKK